MEDIYKIQLASAKNEVSSNVDEYLTVGLDANTREILPYDQTSVISLADLFDDERQTSSVFRIYGDINYHSISNGLKTNYSVVNDFFTRPRFGQEASGGTRNVLNSFDVYLCKPATGNTWFSATTFNYQTKFEILTNLSSFEIYKNGYGKNIFNDQIYSYDFNVDIDIDDQYDSFGKPLTNLFLFFNFKPQRGETVRRKTFTAASTESSNGIGPIAYSTYSAGDIINGDLVYYQPSDFEEIVLNPQEYYVKFPCTGSSTYLEFKYSPFIQVKLRDFAEEVITGKLSGTSETDQAIPLWAVPIGNNNYAWKDILPYGYIDPISGRGVNNSFLNLRHYVFNEVNLSLNLNLNDSVSATNMANIILSPNTLINTMPMSDLNNLGKKC